MMDDTDTIAGDMAATELGEVLDLMDWPSNELAKVLGCNDRTVRRWVIGQNPVPPGIVRWLRELRLLAERELTLAMSDLPGPPGPAGIASWLNEVDARVAAARIAAATALPPPADWHGGGREDA